VPITGVCYGFQDDFSIEFNLVIHCTADRDASWLSIAQNVQNSWKQSIITQALLLIDIGGTRLDEEMICIICSSCNDIRDALHAVL